MVVNELVPANYAAEAKHIGQGIADVAKELKAPFDDHEKLSAGLTIDPKTCAKAQFLFISGQKHFQAAGMAGGGLFHPISDKMWGATMGNPVARCGLYKCYSWFAA